MTIVVIITFSTSDIERQIGRYSVATIYNAGIAERGVVHRIFFPPEKNGSSQYVQPPSVRSYGFFLPIKADR
jgi:hypothetical protein